MHESDSSRADGGRSGLLGSLLGSVRLRSTVYFRPEYRAPWAVAMNRRLVSFHIIASGECWLEVKGIEPLRLRTGDLAILPRAHPHILRDSPTTPAVDFFDLVGRHRVESGQFRAGGTGAITTMVCGALKFEHGLAEPLLAVLPPVLHVTGERQRSSLSLTLRNIVDELESAHPGFEPVVTRLGDILFIQAVRSYFASARPSPDSGLLAAIRDPQLGRAVALLHQKPHERWSVASLARHASLSRSAFAARFAQLVGEPPLRYLTRIRLHAAAVKLCESDAKFSAIAEMAGYESTAAFDKAFKRYMGLTPGEYRRTRRSEWWRDTNGSPWATISSRAAGRRGA